MIFNDHELELIISGLPEVDVADIKANTDYTGMHPRLECASSCLIRVHGGKPSDSMVLECGGRI